MNPRDGIRSDREAATRRDHSNLSNQASSPALEVTDVVHRGSGQGSRFDLTVVYDGRWVRLSLLAKHVLSYRSIESAAIEHGLVLPWFPSANGVWRELFRPAMARARFEPSLARPEMSEAIASEIRALLEGSPRGESASDLEAGKVVEREGCLLVSPETFVRAVRSRLMDDAPPRAAIAESARRLGMAKDRHRFADGRPRVWSFPLAAGVARELSEPPLQPRPEPVSSEEVERMEGPGAAHESPERSAGTTVAPEIGRINGEAAAPRANGIGAGPVHGPEVMGPISHSNMEMDAGPNGPGENAFWHPARSVRPNPWRSAGFPRNGTTPGRARDPGGEEGAKS